MRGRADDGGFRGFCPIRDFSVRGTRTTAVFRLSDANKMM